MLQVVEYSEISSSSAELRHPNGDIVFSAGNICNHYFTVPFLESVCSQWEGQLVHHVANKKIPFVDESGNKYELLSLFLSLSPPPSLSLPTSSLLLSHYRYSIESNQLLRMELNWRSSYLMYFNSQSECDRVGVSLSCPTPCHAHRKFAVLDVSRQDEFSPLKNAEGAPSDTPTTCRDALMSLHYRQLIGSGGVVSVENGTPPRYLPANQIAHLDVMGVAYCYIIFNFN